MHNWPGIRIKCAEHQYPHVGHDILVAPYATLYALLLLLTTFQRWFTFSET